MMFSIWDLFWVVPIVVILTIVTLLLYFLWCYALIAWREK